MPTLTINGREVAVPKGTPIIRAAAIAGFNVPHFCYHPALSAPANCRMCLVEVERARKLEPACYLKCTDGMVVHTESEKVVAARQAVLEFVLVNHPVDCPICDQAGECKLQDYYMAYDAKPSRVRTPKVGKAKVYPIGPNVIYDGERCILCTRCVRFCDQVTGTSELTVVERADHSEIRTFPGKELDNPYSMNVTDICPVGALTTRDFRFKCRVWLMSSADSVCAGCAKGCNIHLEHFQGEVQRYRPRFNANVNEYWMCDAGRLSYKELHNDRLLELRVGKQTEVSWPRAARGVGMLIDELLPGGGIALCVSAQASLEGLFAAKTLGESILGGAKVFWSGRPDGDGDDFLISADKNPNRAGIAAIFGEATLANDAHALLEALRAGEVRALYMIGAELPFTDAAEHAEFGALASKTKLFVLQAAHRGSLADIADVALPSATHAEQDGTFINDEGLMQEFWRAIPCKGQSLPDWEILTRVARGADKTFNFSKLDQIRSEFIEGIAAAAEG